MSLQQNQFSLVTVKGALDLKFNLNTVACEVDSTQATALIPGQAVTIVDSAGGVPKVIAVSSDTDVVFGVVNYNIKNPSFAASMPVEISIGMNVVYMEASAAIARGADVMVVVSGSKVATATAGKAILGKAFDKAVNAGDLIRVQLKTFPFAESVPV